MKIQVTLRSGAQIETDVEEFTMGKNALSGQLRELGLTFPDGALRRLQYLDASEVVAIVSIHDPNGWVDRPVEDASPQS